MLSGSLRSKTSTYLATVAPYNYSRQVEQFAILIHSDAQFFSEYFLIYTHSPLVSAVLEVVLEFIPIKLHKFGMALNFRPNLTRHFQVPQLSPSPFAVSTYPITTPQRDKLLFFTHLFQHLSNFHK